MFAIIHPLRRHLIAIACGVYCMMAAVPSVHANPAPLKIAVMPDVHFHDVYAQFSDPQLTTEARVEGKLLIRSMAAQLQSTRIFNESYFAFTAALDDAIAQGAKIILLPGDFSDDGQPIHMRGLHQRLADYEARHGVRFFATTGNHDPVRPYTSAGGEPDFLTNSGATRAIVSRDHPLCKNAADNPHTPDTLCSDDLAHSGYAEIMQTLARSGFFPRAEDLRWETPYSSDGNSELSQRGYEICAQGARSLDSHGDFSDCKWVPDASYLVEPIKDLWLLAIDSSIYVPQPGSGQDLQGFSGSGNAGYNRMSSHKPHLLPWIEQVTARARAAGKTLITFSHFPAAPFYQGADTQIAATFGANALQAARVPQAATTVRLQKTGIGLHLAGHMHVTAAQHLDNVQGDFLNLQIPSIAAYRPGYLLLDIQSQRIHVQLRPLDEVKDFNSLFPYYAREHAARVAAGDTDNLWDASILNAANYREFTHQHLQALVRGRLLENDWPGHWTALMRSGSLADLLIASGLPALPVQDLAALRLAQDWQAQAHFRRASLAPKTLAELQHRPAIELAYDFYRLLNAGPLGREDVDAARIASYKILQAHVKDLPQQHAEFIDHLCALVIHLYEHPVEFPASLTRLPQLPAAATPTTLDSPQARGN